MENEKSTGNKYTVKDAAIIGIFCAVMFVVFMVYSTLTGASLFYSMIFNAAGAALILAPFYVYMAAASLQNFPCAERMLTMTLSVCLFRG